MNDDVDLVRSRVNIVDLVSQRVSLKRTGKNWKGLCPFHDDKNPSFDVNPTLGRYQCWSCGAKGDIFNWVMQTQNVGFADALRILAQEAGVTLSRQKKEGTGKRELYEQAMSLALQFFREQLKKDRAALEYCSKRGLDEGAIDDYELGFSPDVGEALAVALQKAKLPLADCKSLFLVEQDGSGGYFDRFRGRLMFPIRDERGALVAFGGRILGDGIPKYINSSDTPLYSKRRVLYGLNRAKDAIAKSKRAVLVEGYLDVIACHRAGAMEAVASLGTALSEDHGKLLKRWADDVVVLYDGDAAGQKAAERAAEILLEQGLRVKISLTPEGEDPDALLRSAGSQAVLNACSGGLSPLDYRILRIQSARTPTEPEYWEEIASTLAGSRNHLEVETHIVPLAAKYPGIRDPIAAERALRRQIQQARKRIQEKPRFGEAAVLVKPVETKMDRRELAIFQALLSESTCAAAYEALKDPLIFVTELAAELAAIILESFPSGPPNGQPMLWLQEIQDDEGRERFISIAMLPNQVLNEQTLRHAIGQLRTRRDLNSVRPLKETAGEDDTKLREIQEKLQKAKSEMPVLLNEPRTQTPS